MRFTAVLFAGVFAAFASAQSTTVSSAPSATTDPVQASMIACLDKCTAGDVDCTARCIAVPNPNGSQVNATNECVADCPQGNGTATDNLNYANCVQGCIGQYYFTTSGTPQATGGSGSGSSGSNSASPTASGSGSAASGSASGTASGTASGSASGTASGTASGASSSPTNAAEALRVGTAGVGLLGLLAAFVAL